MRCITCVEIWVAVLKGGALGLMIVPSFPKRKVLSVNEKNPDRLCISKGSTDPI